MLMEHDDADALEPGMPANLMWCSDPGKVLWNACLLLAIVGPVYVSSHSGMEPVFQRCCGQHKQELPTFCLIGGHLCLQIGTSWRPCKACQLEMGPLHWQERAALRSLHLPSR